MKAFRFSSIALALLLGSVSLQAQNGCKPSDPVGQFDGTAVSQQAGNIQVTLNLRCDKGSYAGEIVSSVGNYTVSDGHFDTPKLYLTVESNGNAVDIQATLDAGTLRGTFTSGGDSGSLELHRKGDTAAAASQADDAKPAVETLTADTPRVTSAGASFKVPAGWSIETRKEPRHPDAARNRHACRDFRLRKPPTPRPRLLRHGPLTSPSRNVRSSW